MGKRFLLFLLLVAICLIAVGCTGRTNQNEEPDEEMIIMIEEMQRRLTYLRRMWFLNTIGDSSDNVILVRDGRAEIIFVHNEDEARALFPDRCWEGYDHNNPPDVLVAWPDPERSQGVINGIHLFTVLSRAPDVDIEEFSLSYPITLEDLVDNWEKVDEMWWSLSSTTRGLAFGEARLHGSETWRMQLEERREEIAAEAAEAEAAEAEAAENAG